MMMMMMVLMKREKLNILFRVLSGNVYSNKEMLELSTSVPSKSRTLNPLKFICAPLIKHSAVSEQSDRPSAEVEEVKCAEVSKECVKPPSLLAFLLAQRKSSITVPPCSERTPPLRGSTHPQKLLPYIPHSPFHLFSYDIEEEGELQQRNSGRYTAL